MIHTIIDKYFTGGLANNERLVRRSSISAALFCHWREYARKGHAKLDTDIVWQGAISNLQLVRIDINMELSHSSMPIRDLAYGSKRR